MSRAPNPANSTFLAHSLWSLVSLARDRIIHSQSVSAAFGATHAAGAAGDLPKAKAPPPPPIDRSNEREGRRADINRSCGTAAAAAVLGPCPNRRQTAGPASLPPSLPPESNAMSFLAQLLSFIIDERIPRAAAVGGHAAKYQPTSSSSSSSFRVRGLTSEGRQALPIQVVGLLAGSPLRLAVRPSARPSVRPSSSSTARPKEEKIC